jgi:hypothetical protein
MSILLADQNGNFTGATTNPWQLVDPTSYSNSEAGSTANTTSYTSSATFVPGAITFDSIAIKVASHIASGSVSVRLGKSGTITAIATGNPTQVTSANHGLTTGEAILIAGTNSTPVLTGPYTVTVTGTNTFTVPVNVTVAGTAGTWATVLANITSNTLVAVPVFTTTVAHGLLAGAQIKIKGSMATPSFDGTWTIATVPTATTFTLTGAPSAVGGVSGWGTYNITAVPDTVVAINTTDLPTVNTGTGIGWTSMNLAAAITLTAGTTYSVQISGSGANWVVFRTATATDWSRALTTTTLQAPVAGDTTLICGAYLSPATNSTTTVTMDSTSSATTYGAIEICGGGTLAYGNTASTAYYLKIAGTAGTTTTGIQGYTGGTFNMGTQASPIPSTSTAQLEFACTTAVQYGFDIKQIGFTINTGGNPLTFVSALLASDANSGATSLTTNVSTGWVSGNSIAIASTTQTRAQSEKVTLTANASGTTLTVSTLTNAHGGGGTPLVVAEIINLTRNVQIFSTSTADTTYFNIGGNGTGTNANIQYTEFFNMGSATANKVGINISNITGSVTFNGCSVHDFTPTSAIGMDIAGATNQNITVSNTNFYNITGNCFINAITTAATNTYSNLIGILSGALCFTFADVAGTISNITGVSGTTGGIAIAFTSLGVGPGTVSGLTAHSNTSAGISYANATTYGNNPYSLHSNVTSWRNTTFGMLFGNTFGFIVDGTGNGNIFGNGTAGLEINGSCANVYLRNLIVNAGTTLLQPLGFSIANDVKDFYVDNTTFGATTTHSTGDVQVISSNIYSRLFLRNCALDSPTPVATPINMIEGSEISIARYQQTTGNHKAYYKFGSSGPDTVIFHYASPSTRLTPTVANQKLRTGWKKVAVPNGQTAAISVWVRKSVAGDGTAYNGNQPRLVQRADAATGNNVDTVLATATNAANGAWQQLTATTAAVDDNCAITIYIDCDGTAGWVNIDDWIVN